MKRLHFSFSDRLQQAVNDSCCRRSATVLFSVAATHRALLALNTGRKLLYVTEEDRVDAVAATLSQLGARVKAMPAPFDMMILRGQANLSNISIRLSCLADLLHGRLDALVVGPKALSQWVPKRSRLKQATVTLRVGESIDPTVLADRLSDMGYERGEHADSKGTYAVLGEVVELFSPAEEMPARIVLDYDTIESIKFFHPETMQGVGRTQTLTVGPASDMLYGITPAEVLSRMDKARVLQTPKARARTDELFSEVALRLSANPRDPSLGWIIPFIREDFETLFDYLSADTLVVMDEPQQLFEELGKVEREQAERLNRLVAEGDALKQHRHVRLSAEDVSKRLSPWPRLGFSNYMAGEINEEEGRFAPGSTNLPAYCKDVNLLLRDLEDYIRRGYSVTLCCGSKERVNAMRAMLGDLKLNYLPDRLDKGFVYRGGKCVVVGTADMSQPTAVATTDRPGARVVAPSVGEYVVHEEYGIGQCLGVQHVKSFVGEMDYLVLQYAGENKIYVPMHQMNMLSRYAGKEAAPKLSNPNKEEFKQQKAKARASIRKLAFDLLELYAKREQSVGYRYPPDTPFQQEFEAAFDYELTPDQALAVEQIKRDMQAGRVMDRLLVGDVGFGKTEVALRAIFKTIMQNKQAVFLAPTTILAEQHYMTVLSRLAPFGVKVACLSRFRSAKEVQSILKNLANGTLSVVVGTHRLLSKDVDFYDLGLLVLDEEQRFGVEHKERIKTLRHNVNVLSMSATPIPRTLHMALSGIRDVSVLETPPVGHQSVGTVVGEYSDGLLTDAVRAELARGGQVFILYNSVEHIYSFYHQLETLLPDVSIVVGHGQMSATELERNIYRFYNKEAQVLLATTIIENGIDVPNANTLFVVDAQRLGLSQMYQLKGRVGRSTRNAVAYFTYPSGYVPTGDVDKRFTALTDNAGLGAGYRLALMDLEIRGAGDVLGREQHGHVERIGYDMYCRLLKETIALMKGEPVATLANTEVAINVDAYIPDTYVKVERERLRLYQRIASLTCAKEKEDILADIGELYGKVPPEVSRLLSVSLLRVLGSRVGVTKIEIDAKTCRVRWSNEGYLQSVAVQSALRRIKDECTVIQDHASVVLFPPKQLVSYKMQVVTRLLTYAGGEY